MTGVWRLAPGKWVDLTAAQKQRISGYLDKTNNCMSLSNETEFEGVACHIMQEQLAAGGVYYPAETVTSNYVRKNVLTVGGAFGLTFALVMVIPPLGRRYWLWLRS